MVLQPLRSRGLWLVGALVLGVLGQAWAQTPAKASKTPAKKHGRVPRAKPRMTKKERSEIMSLVGTYYEQWRLVRESKSLSLQAKCQKEMFFLRKITQIHPYPRDNDARKILGTVYLFLTHHYLGLKKPSLALKTAKEGIKRTVPDTRRPTFHAGELYKLKGKALRALGRHKEAATCLKMAEELIERRVKSKKGRGGR